MPTIISFSLLLEDLNAIPSDKTVKGKKGSYIPLSLFINDENDKFGNNVSIQLNQSKEERDAKAAKTYLGNGKVIWSKGDVKTAKSLEGSSSESQDSEWE